MRIPTEDIFFRGEILEVNQLAQQTIYPTTFGPESPPRAKVSVQMRASFADTERPRNGLYEIQVRVGSQRILSFVPVFGN
jgi:hypothetical protein